MVIPLSKIKDVNKAEPYKRVFALTLYNNGVIYIPKAMGGVSAYVTYSCTDETVEICLTKFGEYKKHIYIPRQATRLLCGDRKQIKINFIDEGDCYQNEENNKKFSYNYYVF